jgi:hypothetical protein
MSRSSARRAQVEPLAALAAVLVLGVALGAYVGALDGALPSPTDRNRAEPALGRVADALRPDGVARPARLPAAAAAAPDGYRANVTLAAGDRRWSVGPSPPESADTAARRLPVRVAPGRVRTGRLRVEVWP